MHWLKKFTQQKSAKTGTNQQIPAFPSGIFAEFCAKFAALCTSVAPAMDPFRPFTSVFIRPAFLMHPS
jgi:hypothetical protein